MHLVKKKLRTKIIHAKCMDHIWTMHGKIVFFHGMPKRSSQRYHWRCKSHDKKLFMVIEKKNLKTSHTSEMFVRILDIQYYTKRAQCHKSDAQLIATNCQTLKCVNFSLIYNWKTLISFFQVPKTKKKGKHLEEVPL